MPDSPLGDKTLGSSPARPAFPPSPALQRFLPALVIALAAWLVFQPALTGNWLWDDQLLVTENPEVKSPHGLATIWSGQEEWPLTFTLFWAEWQLWGDHQGWYHLVNLALHVACGLLVWRLFSRLGLRWAWLGGLLFVVHPLAVETGAWISETKNTLSLLFFLLSLLAWLDYDEKQQRAQYIGSVLLYLAAMLAKTSTIMLPAVCLLYGWWKRGRVTRRELKEMAPYLVIAVLLGALTFYRQHYHGVPADTSLSGGFFTRLFCAPCAWLFYLNRFLFPVDFLPVYPRWSADHGLLLQLLLPVAVLLLGSWWVTRQGWERHAALGLGFFTLNLLPVLGIIWMKFLNVSPVSDRLAYLPMIGQVGLTVAALEQIDARLSPRLRPGGMVFVAMIVGTLMVVGRGEAALFVDHETLWAYTLARNPNAWPALNDLGNDLLDEDRFPEAIDYYRRALQLSPNNPDILNNIGNVFARTGHFDEAAQTYVAALRLKPDMVNTHINLANVLQQTGHFDEAIAQYQAVLYLDPGNPKACYNLGNALQQDGRYSEAVEQYQAALAANPDDPAIWTNMGAALQQEGQIPDAMNAYQTALQLDPLNADAHASLGSAFEQQGEVTEAMAQYEEALKINPQLDDIRRALARLQQKPKPPAAK